MRDESDAGFGRDRFVRPQEELARLGTGEAGGRCRSLEGKPSDREGAR